MANVLLSYDIHAKNSEARQAFKDHLLNNGWSDRADYSGYSWKLPETTLVATKTVGEFRIERDAARTAAKAIDPSFSLTRFVLTRLEILDIDSEDKDRQVNPAERVARFRDFINRANKG